jgi:hypothetical protein
VTPGQARSKYTMTKRRHFLLEDSISGTETASMMCRVVSSKTLPLNKFAPYSTISSNEPPHNTNDIIPSILPTPLSFSSRKEFLQGIRDHKIRTTLASFFGLSVTCSEGESVALESLEVKRYTLLNPEKYFESLLANQLYARDVHDILEKSTFNQAYLVTGFLTTTGTVWKTKHGRSNTDSVSAKLPLAEATGVPVPGLSDFSASAERTTATRHLREMYVAEEEIFAVAYSTVKLSRSFNLSAAHFMTKSPVVGRPKRAGARHLALGLDSEEEIDAHSDSEVDEALCNDEKKPDMHSGAKIMLVDEEAEIPVEWAHMSFVVDCA